nr:family 1 glycosylhydrolase [Blastococcus saxobsidens]
MLLALVLATGCLPADRGGSTSWWEGTTCGSAAASPAALPSADAVRDDGADPLAVGVQFHGLWQEYTDSERARVLDQFVAAGVETVRIDVSWAMLQPDGPDSYSEWGVGFVDDVLTMAHERGLEPLVTLWLSPEWASEDGDERALPTDPVDYGRVARWAAQRWQGKVAAWEVWNEPNDDDFARNADPAAYADLLEAAYCGFKTGAPETPVVFGGTSYVDLDWIAAAYEAGAGDRFDVMGIHPYMGVADSPPETPDGGSGRTLAAVGDLHELMAAKGDADKPIWVTEMGWSAHPDTGDTPDWARGVAASVQGDYLVRALDLLRAEHPYVERFYWYTDRDRQTGDTHYDNYGLLTQDLQPKPAYRALAAYLLR